MPNWTKRTRSCQICQITADITLIDIRMPIMDGIKASEIILNENIRSIIAHNLDEEEFV